MSQAGCRLLLVATHPRSGTHLTINALCLNLRGLRFRLVRGQFPTLERLLLDHDPAYAEELARYVAGEPGVVTVVKTHLRPSDMRAVLETADFLSPRGRSLFERIAAEARCLHVYRDGRDTLVSWYHYMKDAGGGFPSDMPPRLRELTFADFLRMPNKYYPCVRGFRPEDRNRAAFWAACADEWTAARDTVQLGFESLIRDRVGKLTATADALGLRDRLLPAESLCLPPMIRPPRRGPLGRLLFSARLSSLARHHRRNRGILEFPPPPPFARGGRSGEWRRYFGAAELEFFAEHAGATMRRLGYA